MDTSSSHFERSNGPVVTLNCGGPNDFLLNAGLKSDYVGLSHHHGDGWSPSAPSPGLVLFNSEEQSDLIFIVTMDSSNHRPDRDDLKFPAHSFIIKESSPIFKEIIHQLNQRQSNQNSDQKPIINIQCRPETLHMLMSYIYKKEVEISSVSSCLALLEVSVKFMLTELTRICLTFLWNCASEFNVLQILTALRKIDSNNHYNYTYRSLKSNGTNSDHHQPANGHLHPLHHRYNYHPYYQTFGANYENLLNEVNLRCYQILDENAEKILRSEAVCDLDRDMLMDILRRDTLNLESELTAFDCIQRWSVYQCQRELREIGHKTKSDLLGEAKYMVRYLTMTKEQFIKGPYSSDILSLDDKSALHEKLLDADKPLPKHLMSAKIDIPRKFLKAISSGGKSLLSQSNANRTSRALAPYDRKKNSALKKLLSGLGDVMIFAIRIFD
ncbi:BTB/POZ domain-containing protein 6-like [Brevipalpus obovatus]|uniref:BTB/POZ domain-containing protein 6-like n=1 Tax=Brevipalpus obovatus TaxID=246614 RepID=UPI003D9F2FE4